MASNLCLPFQLAENIDNRGIKEYQSVQKEILHSTFFKNLLINTRPGSGKKTAYVIRVLARIDPDRNETQAIIVAPTAELVHYIASLARDMAARMKIRVVQASNEDRPGEKVEGQLIVTTLGTLNFMQIQKRVVLTGLEYLVFDEFDLMTNSVKKSIILRTVLKNLPERFQLMVFTSMPVDEDLQDIPKMFPGRSFITRQLSTTKEALHFKVFATSVMKKQEKLTEVMRNVIRMKSIIFCEVKRTRAIAEHLKSDDIQTILIQAPSNHEDSIQLIEQFNKSEQLIALCLSYPTGHGIPMPEASMLLNFDLPRNRSEYHHRMCKCGDQLPPMIVNFVDRESAEYLECLEQYYPMVEIRF